MRLSLRRAGQAATNARCGITVIVSSQNALSPMHLRGLVSRVSLIICVGTMLLGCADDQATLQLPRFESQALQQGRATWMQVCRNCHPMGVAGAPAISDDAAWQPRLARDRQSLYDNAISGIRDDSGWRMPPRGGNETLSDGDVRRAVDYMLAAVEALQHE